MDGVRTAAVKEVAKFQRLSNAAREIDKLTGKHVPLVQRLEVYKCSVPMESKIGDAYDDGCQHMVLPHECAHEVRTLYPDVFKRMMNTDNLASFWDRQPP